jgi:hypothetical protein
MAASFEDNGIHRFDELDGNVQKHGKNSLEKHGNLTKETEMIWRRYICLVESDLYCDEEVNT